MPRVGQVHARLVLEDEAQREKATLCRGYVYPGHEVYGAGGVVIRAGDQLRLETRSAVSGIILQPRATLLREESKPGGWTGTDKGSLEGPGALRVVSGTDPGAGTEVDESVPTNARWKLYGIRASLVTSADVGTRRVAYTLDDGTTIYLFLVSSDTQGASETKAYNMSSMGLEHAVRAGNVHIGGPTPITVLQAYRIRTSTENLDTVAVADNYGAPAFEVEELIEE